MRFWLVGAALCVIAALVWMATDPLVASELADGDTPFRIGYVIGVLLAATSIGAVLGLPFDVLRRLIPAASKRNSR